MSKGERFEPVLARYSIPSLVSTCGGSRRSVDYIGTCAVNGGRVAVRSDVAGGVSKLLHPWRTFSTAWYSARERSLPSLLSVLFRLAACSRAKLPDQPLLIVQQIEGPVITENVVRVRTVVCIPVVARVFRVSKTKLEKFDDGARARARE